MSSTYSAVSEVLASGSNGPECEPSGGIIAIMLGYGWWFFGAVAAFEVYCALVVWIRWHAY